MRRPVKSDDEEPKRKPADTIDIPYDPVGEQVLIAAALVDPEVRASLVKRIKAENFSVPDHISAWTNVVVPMARQAMGYDPAAVQQLCGTKLDTSYLTDLAESRSEAPDQKNLDYHVNQLLWDSARMTAVKGPLASLLAGLRDPHTKPDRVQSLAKQLQLTLGTYGEKTFLCDSDSVVRAQVEEIRQRMSGIAVFGYGIDGLDFYENRKPRLIPGTKPGLTTVITGVSGHGKSTTTAAMVLGMARKRRKVLYGAWEMNAGRTLELLACLSLGYSRTALTTGRLTEDELTKLHERMTAITRYVTFMKNPFFDEENAGKRPSVERNLDCVERHIAMSGCHVFVADLWERCLVTDDPGEENRALKAQQNIHERYQIHGILVQQQSIKALEARRDKWPTQGTMMGSTAWVHIADTIIGWNRPSLWKNVSDAVIEGHVLKQRDGPYPLMVELAWDPDTGQLGEGTSVPYPRSEGVGGGAGDSVFAEPRRGRRG